MDKLGTPEVNEEWCISIAYPARLYPQLDDKIDDLLNDTYSNMDSGVGVGFGEANYRDAQYYFPDEQSARKALEAIQRIDEIEDISLHHELHKSWTIKGNGKNTGSTG